MDTNNLGKVLRQRRRSKKLTLKQVSDIAGMHESYLGRIETGVRFPSGHILRKLAKPLGFSQIELQKLAGYISWDESDDRLYKFKKEIKREIAEMLVSLHKKIDSF